jgi:hypothetical protein
MRTTKLGDLTVSAQGLGCMGMSEWYGATDWDESIATINRALDLGVTFIDTADIYGTGHNVAGTERRRPRPHPDPRRAGPPRPPRQPGSRRPLLMAAPATPVKRPIPRHAKKVTRVLG